MNLQMKKRRGIVLIIVLACLAIASALLIIGVKLAVTSHRVAQTVSCMAQAELLVDSGIQRAAAQLAADAHTPAKLGRFRPRILAQRSPDLLRSRSKPWPSRPNQRLVKIQADFPDDPLDRVRYSKELTLELQ